MSGALNPAAVSVIVTDLNGAILAVYFIASKMPRRLWGLNTLLQERRLNVGQPLEVLSGAAKKQNFFCLRC